MKRKGIACCCGERHEFTDLKRIVTHWYVEPYGCTGGAYWKEGEWQYVCPKKSKRVRIMFGVTDADHELERAFKRRYSDGWGESVDVYGDDEEDKIAPISIPWSNNYAVASLPVYYGIAKRVTETTTRIEAVT